MTADSAGTEAERRNGGQMGVGISVVMSLYNSASYLDAALGSLAGQTRHADEIILIDDGSTDSSLEVAKKWEPLLPLNVISLGRNRGPGAARNVGIEAARFEAIAVFDSDDIALPQHLEHCESLYRSGKTLVSAKALVWNPSGSVRPYPRHIPATNQLDALAQRNIVFIASMFSRETALAVGGFGEKVGGEDWQLWLHLVASGATIVEGAFPTVLYRRHENSISQKRSYTQGTVELLDDLRSAYPAHARSFDRAKMFLSAQQALERAETHLEEGHAIEARREVTTVLRYGDRRLRFLGAALMATPNPLAKRLLLRRRMS